MNKRHCLDFDLNTAVFRKICTLLNLSYNIITSRILEKHDLSKPKLKQKYLSNNKRTYLRNQRRAKKSN